MKLGGESNLRTSRKPVGTYDNSNVEMQNRGLVVDSTFTNRISLEATHLDFSSRPRWLDRETGVGCGGKKVSLFLEWLTISENTVEPDNQQTGADGRCETSNIASGKTENDWEKNMAVAGLP